MNISKRNPLYKLALAWTEEDYRVPTNLCPFVRHAVYGLVKCVGLTIAAMLMALIFSFFVVSVFYALTWLIFMPFALSAEDDLLGFGLWGLIAIAIAAGWYAGKFVFLIMKQRQAIAPKHELSVIGAYVRAKHDKICPPIEFI